MTITREELKRRMYECGGISPDDEENDAVESVLERLEYMEARNKELEALALLYKSRPGKLAVSLDENKVLHVTTISPEHQGQGKDPCAILGPFTIAGALGEVLHEFIIEQAHGVVVEQFSANDLFRLVSRTAGWNLEGRGPDFVVMVRPLGESSNA